MEINDSIEIVFKNLDMVRLTSKYLNHLYLGDVVQSYSTYIDKDSGDIGLVSSLVANKVKIYINSDMKNNKSVSSLFGENAFKRLLKSKDITQIRINFSDRKEQYFVYWNDEDECSNKFQINELIDKRKGFVNNDKSLF